MISGPLATGAAWNDFLNLLEKLCLFKHLIFLDTISGDKDVIRQKNYEFMKLYMVPENVNFNYFLKFWVLIIYDHCAERNYFANMVNP